MLANILIGIGSVIFILLGCAHLAFTFFTDSFNARDPAVITAMKSTSPVLTGRTSMWQAWIGFNASHSLGAMLFGSFYLLLATRHPELLREDPLFMLVALLTCGFLVFLSLRYWFRDPIIGIVLASTCFVLGAALM